MRTISAVWTRCLTVGREKLILAESPPLIEVRPQPRDAPANRLLWARDRFFLRLHPNRRRLRGVSHPFSMPGQSPFAPIASRMERMARNIGMGAGRASDWPSTTSTETKPYCL